MSATLPVLVACRHLPENLEAAKGKIDHYFSEGRRFLAIELYPGHNPPFFGTLKHYAELKGMTVIPIDSPLGAKLTDKLIDSIEFAKDVGQRVPRLRKELTADMREASYKIYALAESRSKIMVRKLRRVLAEHPDCLIMVGFGHDALIRREIPVKFEKIGRFPIISKVNLMLVSQHRRLAKKSRARRLRKLRPK